MLHKTPLALLIVVTFLIGADYLAAQWTTPSALPPGNNVAAPINVSGNPQTKAGLLGVNQLIANALMVGRADLPTATTDVAVAGSVAASAYCDANGQNCFTADTIDGSSVSMTCVNRTGAGSASCVAGEIATGGGGTSSCAGVRSGDCTAHAVISSRPTTNGWACTTSNNPVTSVRCCVVN